MTTRAKRFSKHNTQWNPPASTDNVALFARFYNKGGVSNICKIEHQAFPYLRQLVKPAYISNLGHLLPFMRDVKRTIFIH